MHLFPMIRIWKFYVQQYTIFIRNKEEKNVLKYFRNVPVKPAGQVQLNEMLFDDEAHAVPSAQVESISMQEVMMVQLGYSPVIHKSACISKIVCKYQTLPKNLQKSGMDLKVSRTEANVNS